MEYSLGQRLRDLPGPLLLTGHTGFKGTWMTFLLEHLNVPVVGYSLRPEKDSLYDRAERVGSIPEAFADIRDYEALEQFIDLHKPSTIIHMAAQPLVLKSYESPRATFDVNVMGTANVLDVAFKKDFVKAIIVVTTDKVYRNDNSGRAFVETDPLEGKDPYSASKVGAEAVVAAWQQISKVSGGPKLVSVRAGNVIGGGDFSENRIIPDIIRGVLTGRPIEIRNPKSTRPWQHVLDVSLAYLACTEILLQELKVDTINIGPSEQSLEVGHLIKLAKNFWPEKVITETNLSDKKIESENLRLDTSLASNLLDWRNRCTQIEAINLTLAWWDAYIFKKETISVCIKNDLVRFCSDHKI
jgi:CDP-glucose 4,6-dehydratase